MSFASISRQASVGWHQWASTNGQASMGKRQVKLGLAAIITHPGDDLFSSFFCISLSTSATVSCLRTFTSCKASLASGIKACMKAANLARNVCADAYTHVHLTVDQHLESMGAMTPIYISIHVQYEWGICKTLLTAASQQYQAIQQQKCKYNMAGECHWRYPACFLGQSNIQKHSPLTLLVITASLNDQQSGRTFRRPAVAQKALNSPSMTTACTVWASLDIYAYALPTKPHHSPSQPSLGLSTAALPSGICLFPWPAVLRCPPLTAPRA